MANAYDKTLESQMPGVAQNGLITVQPVDMTDSATVKLPAGTTINGSSLTALGTITSTSANALAVGRQGTTGPAFNVDASTASQADGIGIVGLAAGNGATLATITTGTNAPLTIDAAGSGTIGIGLTSTGAVTIKPATTVTGIITSTGGIVVGSAKKIEGAGTGTNGIILKNLKNAAAGSLSGTALNVEIDIGGTPYYFAVYPTKT